MWTIGIDPGQKGAVCVLNPDGKIDEMFKMPIIKLTKGHDIYITSLISKLSEWVNPIRAVAFVEKCQAMPGQGIVSMFNYGRGYGQIVGALTAMGFPVTLVHPKTWKNKMTKDMSKGKDAHIQRVSQLYGLSLEKSQDGVADAILIATYGRKYG